MSPRKCASALFVSLLALAAGRPATAAPPSAQALTGARIVVAPGRVLEQATVVVRDGVIVAVGSNLTPPADARIWDLTGKSLYPGLIDPWVVRPWPLDKVEDRPQTSHSNSLVRPERSVVDRLRDDKAWRALRAAGFTTALVVPGDGILRGGGALINLGDDPRAALLRAGAVQAVALHPPERQDGYPESLMGAVALFRQTVLDARWHRRAQALYRANPAQKRPLFDSSLAAFEPAAHGESTIVFETESILEQLRATAIAQELGVRAWTVGSGREYQRLAELAARPLPILLPVAFPEPPKVGESDDLTVTLEELRHWDEAPTNPARLAEAKMVFALTAFRQKEPMKIWVALARALERGLAADLALGALTKVPAELLGISGRAGTIEVGKMANFVQVEGELMVAEPKIEAVWIDGQRFDHAADTDAKPDAEKKKGGPR